MSDTSLKPCTCLPQDRPLPGAGFALAIWLGLGGMLLGVAIFVVSGSLLASTLTWLLTGSLSLVLDALIFLRAEERKAAGCDSWGCPFPILALFRKGVLNV